MNNFGKSSTGMPLPGITPAPTGNRNSPPAKETDPLGPGKGMPTPEVDTPHGKLSEDETTLILNATLKPQHRSDPNVLKFIAAYMRCRSANQAAREAGLNPRDGTVLKNRADIWAAIQTLTTKSVSKYGFDASEVVERVKEIAEIDPIEFVRADGSFIEDLNEIRPEARRAIRKFKAKNLYEDDPNGMPRVVGKLIEVELWDKMKGVELLGREKDLFVEKKKVEHDVSKNMSALLLESKQRADARQMALNMRDVIQIEGKADEQSNAIGGNQVRRVREDIQDISVVDEGAEKKE